MQVVHHQDDVDDLGGKHVGPTFEIDEPRGDRQASPPRLLRQLAQGIGVAVDGRHAVALLGQPQRVTPAAAGDVQRIDAGQQVPVHRQPGSRGECAHGGSVLPPDRLAIACPATQPDDQAH